MIYRAGVPFVQSRNHNNQASLLFLGDQIRAKKRLELGSSASIEINPQTLEMQVIGVNPNANVFVGFKKVAANNNTGLLTFAYKDAQGLQTTKIEYRNLLRNQQIKINSQGLTVKASNLPNSIRIN